VSSLFDTSVVLGPASSNLPDEAAISVVTLAEVRLGVLIAPNAAERSVRLQRLLVLERIYAAIPVDEDVAGAYATIVAGERERGRRPRPMDALIAATALAKDLTLYTRDQDLARISAIRVRLIE
jgi:predicted nucleic acid-binding protein